MFEVYFGNLNKKDKLAIFKNFDLAEKFILNHIKENQKSHYIRFIIEDNGNRWFDYGSHTNFYYIFNLKS